MGASIKATIGYERPPLLEDGQTDPFEGIDKAMLKEVGRYIQEHHPRLWPWIHARADHSQGVLLLWFPKLMGDINRMIVHTERLDSGPAGFELGMRHAIGELLERYRLARDRTFNADVMREAIAKAPVIGLNAVSVPE